MAIINWSETKLLAEIEVMNLFSVNTLMLIQINDKFHILRLLEEGQNIYPVVDEGCFAKKCSDDMELIDLDSISEGTTDENEAWNRWGNYLTWWSIKFAREEQNTITRIVRMSDEYRNKILPVDDPHTPPDGFEHYLDALNGGKEFSLSSWRDPKETMKVYTYDITVEDEERFRAFLNKRHELS